MLVVFLFLFALTSCSGYNTQMREHLSNETNYHPYRGSICDVYYLDADYKKISLLSTDDIPHCDVVMELTFEDYGTVKTLLGGEPNPSWALDEYKFAFDITKEINQILIENGFYDAIDLNALIEIMASSFIYMDADFFFVAGVTYNETEFLSFGDGIRNIREYITNHESLL